MNNLFAFPTEGPSPGQFEHPGMTLRDYFAAKALQGWLASTPGNEVPSPDIYAEYAYRMADAMMKARELQDDNKV